VDRWIGEGCLVFSGMAEIEAQTGSEVASWTQSISHKALRRGMSSNPDFTESFGILNRSVSPGCLD
jgi:hypothetical protein